MRRIWVIALLVLVQTAEAVNEPPAWLASPDPSRYLLAATELPPIPAEAGEVRIDTGGYHLLIDHDYRIDQSVRIYSARISQYFTNPADTNQQAQVHVVVYESAFYAKFTWRVHGRLRGEDQRAAIDDFYRTGGAGMPNPYQNWHVVGNLRMAVGGNWTAFKDAYLAKLLDKHAALVGPPQREPCPEARFFYNPDQLDGYYTDQPSLLYQPDEMVADLRRALRQFVQEGGRARPGVQSRDSINISAAMQTGALPTGQEAALHQAAKELAATRPGGRIDAGDLLYLSLKLHQGDVRSALLACHAALYRGNAANAPFVNTVLRPIRNPDGYSDQKVVVKAAGGAEIDARRAVGSDHQGPYYHIFGLAALQLADDHSWTPFWAMRMGAEYFNPRAKELREDFPTSEFGGRLANYAVALENEMRRASAVDPDKHCLNYAGIRAGVALNEELGRSQPPLPTHAPTSWQGDVLRPDGTVVYRSPLSLEIVGKRGERFAFDQRTKRFSGNTPLVIIEPIPEADGTWGLAVTPLFEVESWQLIGAGSGRAEVGVYSHAGQAARVFPLQLNGGERIEVADWRGTPALRSNGRAVTAFGQPAAPTTPAAPPAAAPPAAAPPAAAQSGELVVCRAVSQGQPQGAADQFAQASELCAFWRFQNRPRAKVTCVWSRAGAEVMRQEQEVSGNGSVWFTFRTGAAGGFPAGDWTVALFDGQQVLARRAFRIGN